MKKSITKSLLLFIVLAMCLSILVSCGGADRPTLWLGRLLGTCWTMGFLGAAPVYRGVCVKDSDVNEFIEQYVSGLYTYTVDLPENYPDLVSVSYSFRANNYIQTFSPRDFCTGYAIISFEFNIDGEQVCVFLSIPTTHGAVRNEFRLGIWSKQEGDELKVMQDTPFANPDNLAPLDYDFEANKTSKTEMALYCWPKNTTLYLDGYKPSGIFKKLFNSRGDKNYITEVYSEDGKYVKEDARFFFHDPRDISAEEKQAWQMQVIKDILANMKCYYWAAPEA